MGFGTGDALFAPLALCVMKARAEDPLTVLDGIDIPFEVVEFMLERAGLLVCCAWQEVCRVAQAAGAAALEKMKAIEHAGEAFGRRGAGPGEYSAPFFLAATPTDLVISDLNNHRLQVVSSEGMHMKTLGAHWLRYPTGVASDGIFLWVADAGRHCVHKLTLDGELLLTACGHGGPSVANPGGVDLCNSPQGIALTADGGLALVDQCNYRVVLLDADTLSWRRSFSLGQGQQRAGCFGIASQGQEIFVADGCIKVFSLQGELRRLAGSGGASPGACPSPGQFQYPFGVALLGSDRLLVTDRKSRLQVLSLGGEPLQVLSFPGAMLLGGVCARGDQVFVADGEGNQVHVMRRAMRSSCLTPRPSRAAVELEALIVSELPRLSDADIRKLMNVLASGLRC